MEKTIEDYGRLLGVGIREMLDRHAAAAKADDQERLTAIRVEIVGAISELVIAAAARGRTMTAAEAAFVLYGGEN